MAKKMICDDCGHVGYPKTITKGSFGLELLLWLFFILPGLAYSIWRLASRYKGCSACGSANLVPLETPRGRELQERYGIDREEE